jgi:3-isopropylmalate dehydratase small subunit
MGDQDIAYAWAAGKVWFKVPKSARVVLKGRPGSDATAKDIVLKMLQTLGADGLLGYAAEIVGEVVPGLPLPDRITIASLATEMGGIIALFEPSPSILEYCRRAGGRDFPALAADDDAHYDLTVEVDIEGLAPMIARPGHPEDTVPVATVAGRKVAPGVVLKVVPATRAVWRQALDEGLVQVFTEAGALIGNAGCGGCAAGQIGQNGPGEVTISTGNRNFAGKQGKGEVYLASPATAAASAAAGVICTAASLPAEPVLFAAPAAAAKTAPTAAGAVGGDKPTVLTGRAWIVDVDNVDTDMIFHNRYLAITDAKQMGQYTFDNLEGWQDFARKALPGDIVVTGGNFGCGSSRQQAVDCFATLGVQALVARSYGAIYERNAINAGLPVLVADAAMAGLKSGDTVTVDLGSGLISWTGGCVRGEPCSQVQMEIYQRGGLLAK